MTNSPVRAAPFSAGSAHALGPVADDWQAAQIWIDLLAARPVSSATLANYNREIRRLRWYCDTQMAPPPGRWTYQDVLAYTTFLQERSGEHISADAARPGQRGWTPFKARLSAASVSEVRKILNTLFSFWTQSGYLRFNPFAGQVAGGKNASANPSRRAIPEQLQQWVIAELEGRPKSSSIDHLLYHRDRFVLFLFLRTGIRAHEAAASDMVDVGPHSDPKTGRVYWGQVLRTQKGGGESLVYWDPSLVEEFCRYRLAFRLPAAPQPGETLGLILSPLTSAGGDRAHTKWRRNNANWRAIRTRQGVYKIVKTMLLDAAKRAELEGDSAGASLLERASTHWLRHTRATEIVIKHDLRVAAKVLRHSDVRTTMKYTNLDFYDVARVLDDPKN